MSVTFSCIQEPESPSLTLENPDLLTARSWYEANLIQQSGIENARQFGKRKGKPNWDNFKIYHQKDGKKVIEVQFDWEEIQIPEHLNTVEFNKSSVLQTLILFPKEDGKHVPYFLSIYPDNSDKQFTLDDFRKGGYQKIPKDFSGEYHFTKPNGKFIGGWLIKDGVRTHSIKQLRPATGKEGSKKSSGARWRCYETYTTWTTILCSADGECHTREEEEVTGNYCVYEDEPETLAPDGPTKGGGGGSPSDPTDPNEDCEVPEAFLEGMTIDCNELSADDVIEYIASTFGVDPNQCEKDLIKKDPRNWPKAVFVYANSSIAENRTIEIFGVNGWRDCADAFRHAYWNALNIQGLSDVDATLFASAHECHSGIESMDVSMDFHNNLVGREIGKATHSIPLWEAVLNSLTFGNLQIISNLNSDGSYSLSSELVSSSQCSLD